MKHTRYLPIELVELFKNSFAYPEKLLFGSVATIHNNCPRIRTMRIYEFNQDGCPILLTHTRSNKWKEFINHPQVSMTPLASHQVFTTLLWVKCYESNYKLEKIE